jgi:hypothetical protein
MMQDFLNLNELTVVNGLSLCKGLFTRIRKTKYTCEKMKFSGADNLMRERNILKKKQDENNTNNDEDSNIKKLEEEISEILAEEGRSKAHKFKKYCAQYGSVNVSEMWNLKKRLWPKRKPSSHSGKINHQGKLVTSPDEIRKLLLKEYTERLRVRPDHPEMKDIFEAKDKAFNVKIENARHNKTKDWNITELEEVL